jgi:hypothetical protein
VRLMALVTSFPIEQITSLYRNPITKGCSRAGERTKAVTE